MRYFALAADYDGTLASDGKVDETVRDALRRLRDTGRKLIMVTGRELNDLATVFDGQDLFDLIVAENGGLIYNPRSREERPLCKPLPDEFIEALHQRNVRPISVGRVIVATWVPHEVAVLGAIRDLNVDAQVIFNKGAVMVLPTGVNKSTGLQAALRELDLSAHNVVGMGDAENDFAFLELCECSAAPSNALQRLKDTVDFVSERDHGAGVVDLVDRMIESDLREFEPRLSRHELVLGLKSDGGQVCLNPYAGNVLVTGSEGAGKTTFATAFLEGLAERDYQFCLFDPEGDYDDFRDAVGFGSAKRPPLIEEVVQLLKKPDQNAVVNLQGVPAADRGGFFERLQPGLAELRTKAGRPHWIVAEEMHHLAPADWGPLRRIAAERIHALMLITAHPGQAAPAVIVMLDLIVGVGPTAVEDIRVLADLTDTSLPLPMPPRPGDQAALAWRRRPQAELFWFFPTAPAGVCKRRQRKFVEGELSPEMSFYFRGPDEKLNLRAQNLAIFLQLSEGVGEEVWKHHLEAGDFARWFRDVLHDEDLAVRTEAIHQSNGSPAAAMEQIRQAICERYTV